MTKPDDIFSCQRWQGCYTASCGIPPCLVHRQAGQEQAPEVCGERRNLVSPSCSTMFHPFTHHAGDQMGD